MSAYGDIWASLRAALSQDKFSRRASVKDVEFLPAALEVVERPVSPLARRTAYVLLLGLLVLALWLFIGRVDIVAAAEGRLEPVARTRLIQPATAGIVRRLYVREGQRVRKGQLLVQLDPTLSAAELEQGQSALLAAQLSAARARAVLGALDGGAFVFIAPEGVSTQARAEHEALARAQLAHIRAQSHEQGASSQAARLAAAEARTQARKISESLPLLDQQLRANEVLLEKGYVSQLRVLELRRQRLAAERDKDAALQVAARASAESGAAQSRRVGSGAAGRAELLQTLVNAEAEIAQRQGQLAMASGRADYGRLVAPVSGTVSQLSLSAEGGIVEALRPVMAIVPDGGMTAEVRLANSDAAFVRPGQAVTVKVHAYPFGRHGTIDGRVLWVGAAAVDDEQAGLVYPLRIQLDDKDARRFQLRPGMAVTADIRTGSRRLIDYLISPVERAVATAARER